MTESHVERYQGNMFLAEMPDHIAHHATPLDALLRGGHVYLNHHTATHSERTYRRCRHCSLSTLGIKLSYLDMRPGDLLLFSKRQMHMSDPRPALRDVVNTRQAAHGRVVVRPAGARGIVVWPGHAYLQDLASSNAAHQTRHWMQAIVSKRAIATTGAQRGNVMIQPTRYEMMGSYSQSG